MDQILARLYLGTLEDAQTFSRGLCAAIVTLSEQKIERPNEAHVVYAPIPDEAWLPRDLWQARIETLQHYLQRCKFTVLVHCRLGVSRSPALCAAYLAYTGWDLDEALAYVQRKRACVKVHPETLRGVREWWCA